MFNELQGNTWSSLAKLRSCIGDVDGDADNALMEAEMKRQRGNTDTGEVRPPARPCRTTCSETNSPDACLQHVLGLTNCADHVGGQAFGLNFLLLHASLVPHSFVWVGEEILLVLAL